MHAARKMALALVLLLTFASSALAERPAFVPVAGAQVKFDHSETFVPVDRLSTVTSNPARLSPQERAKRASAVAVTPDGKLFRSAVTAQDLEIFERAVSALSAARQAGGDAAGAADAADRPAGLEKSAGVAGGPQRVIGRSVIGTDERVQVSPTTYWPWVTMGRIDIGCTGTVVGPRHVITAGHCVYNTDTDSWYYNLNFSAAQDGSYLPFGTSVWHTAITTTGWTVNHDRNYDYAMIILADTLGYWTGYMSYGFDNNLCSNCIVNINGYPGDKPFGTMWHSDCPLTGLQTSRLYYECDTFGGMSGSGVYMYWAPDTRVIYGIHAYGVDHTGDNSATRINSSVFYNFQNWREWYPPAY